MSWNQIILVSERANALGTPLSVVEVGLFEWIATVNAILALEPSLPWAVKAVVLLILRFGGSSMAAWMLAIPAPLFVSHRAVGSFLLAVAMMSLGFNTILSSSAGRRLFRLLGAISGAHTITSRGVDRALRASAPLVVRESPLAAVASGLLCVHGGTLLAQWLRVSAADGTAFAPRGPPADLVSPSRAFLWRSALVALYYMMLDPHTLFGYDAFDAAEARAIVVVLNVAYWVVEEVDKVLSTSTSKKAPPRQPRTNPKEKKKPKNE